MKNFIRCCFLLLGIVFETTIGFGQNTGPVAPETQSFEPVDANSMVDPLTGDFTYVLPLMEVPGPEGGYPITLSYHAGIAVEQEASWIGLGWNLNPGAINRRLNGIPDDVNGSARTTYVITEDQSVTNRSLSVAGGYKGISLGMVFSWQDGKGLTGFDMTTGVSGDIGGGATGGLSISVGSSGVGLGVNAGSQGMSGSASFFYSPQRNSVSVGINASYSASFGNGLSTQVAGVGASIASEGSLGGGVALGGVRLNLSRGAPEHSEYSHVSNDFAFTMPIYYITVGYSERTDTYWLEDFNNDYLFGALYSDKAPLMEPAGYGYYGRQSTSNVMDTYTGRFNELTNYENNKNELKPNYHYMSYDAFSVSAQGLSGTFSAKINEYKNIFGRSRVVERHEDDDDFNIKDETIYLYDTRTFNVSKDKVHFYFKGTGSGYLRIPESTTNYMGFTPHGNPLNTVDGNGDVINTLSDFLTVDNQDYDYSAGNVSHHNSSNNRMANTNHVTYYTNQEIMDGGLINFRDVFPSVDRSDLHLFDPDGIGAFSVVTSDGNQYNYSLPVYQFESVTIDSTSEGEYHEIDFGKYATSWLLTSITGPDFVDNGNGIPDDGDYGYWVRFDYGKWSDSYIWENPYYGYEDYFVKDVQHRRRSFGRKQIYYLNQVVTKSHTALFIKWLRNDGLGGIINYDNEAPIDHPGSFAARDYIIDRLNQLDNQLLGNPWSAITSIGDVVLPDVTEYLTHSSGDATAIGGGAYGYSAQLKCRYQLSNERKHAALGLQKIMLFKNEDLKTKLDDTPWNNQRFNLTYPLVTDGNCEVGVRAMLLSEYAAPMSSLNVWVVGGWYPLYGESRFPLRNQVDHTAFGYQQENVLDVMDLNMAELEAISIKSVDFDHGKNPFHPLPPLGYASNSTDPVKGRHTLHGLSIKGRGGQQILPSYEFDYYEYSEDDEAKLRKDHWGYDAGVHSDVGDVSGKKEHSKNWSLKSILTPLGSTIEVDYESDSYLCEAAINYAQSSSEQPKYRFKVKGVKMISSTQLMLAFDDRFYDISEWFSVGEDYTILLDKMLEEPFIQFSEEAIPLLDEPQTFTCIDVDNTGGWYITLDVSSCSPSPCYFGNLYLTFPNTYKAFLSGYYEAETHPNHFSDKAYVETAGQVGREFWGGGVRVKSLSIKDDVREFQTLYDYRDRYGRKTSGATIYAPKDVNEDNFVPYRSELPAPGVIYGLVTEQNLGTDGSLLGETEYEYEVYNQTPSSLSRNFELPDQFKVSLLQDNFNLGPINQDNSKLAHSYLIEDKLSRIGHLKASTSYNSNGEMILRRVLRTNTGFDKEEIGVSQETFLTKLRLHHRGSADGENSKYTYHVINTSKIEYPTKRVSTEIISDEITSLTEYEEFNITTGAPLTTKTTNSFGETYLSKITPAYLKYEDMGSKVDDEDNHHMLSQVAQNSLYQLEGTTEKLVSTSVQTWNDSWTYRDFNSGTLDYWDVLESDNAERIWRKHATYAWNGPVDDDGYVTSYSEFNYANPGASASDWLKTSEVTRYDRNSHLLESMDSEGRRNSSKMGYGGTLVTSVAATNYLGCAYSGAEDPIDQGGDFFFGEVKGATKRYPSSRHSHTGNYSVHLTKGQIGFEYDAPAINGQTETQGFVKGKMYRSSVWVHEQNKSYAELYCNIYDGTATQTQSADITSDMVLHAGEWYRIDLDVEIPVDAVMVTFGTRNKAESGNLTSLFMDDFRVHPVSSPMSTYVYDEHTGQLSAVLDNDNMGTKYFYDSAGRLIRVEEEIPEDGFVLRSGARYNYGRSN